MGPVTCSPVHLFSCSPVHLFTCSPVLPSVLLSVLLSVCPSVCLSLVLAKLIWDLQSFLSVLDSEKNLSYIAQAQKKSISELLSKLQTNDTPGKNTFTFTDTTTTTYANIASTSCTVSTTENKTFFF